MNTPPGFPPLSALFLYALTLALLTGGCASVSVQPQSAARPGSDARAARPTRLLVETFTFPAPSAIRADRQGAGLAEFDRRLQIRLRDRLVADLRRLGLSADPNDPNVGQPPLRPPAWVVRGQFTRVNQGSRALRVGIGLGAGGTKMETAVQVFDRASPAAGPILAFRTTGGSNAEPGLIASAGTGPVDIAVGAAITAVGSSLHGVTEDADRTARMIAAYLSEDLARRGWLDPAKVKRAKRLGGRGNDE